MTKTSQELQSTRDGIRKSLLGRKKTVPEEKKRKVPTRDPREVFKGEGDDERLRRPTKSRTKERETKERNKKKEEKERRRTEKLKKK